MDREELRRFTKRGLKVGLQIYNTPQFSSFIYFDLRQSA